MYFNNQIVDCRRQIHLQHHCILNKTLFHVYIVINRIKLDDFLLLFVLLFMEFVKETTDSQSILMLSSWRNKNFCAELKIATGSLGNRNILIHTSSLWKRSRFCIRRAYLFTRWCCFFLTLEAFLIGWFTLWSRTHTPNLNDASW